MNRTPFIAVERGLWDWLHSREAYLRLRLAEYRNCEGQLLPFDEDRGFDTSVRFPCIASLGPALGGARRACGAEYSIEQNFQLFVAAESDESSREPIEEALVVCLDAINGSDAVSSGLGIEGVFTVFAKPEGISAWKSLGGGATRGWEARFTVSVVMTARNERG